jgi:8-oxo-dGTP pyrophosphatase MutT (NUDIX family)
MEVRTEVSAGAFILRDIDGELKVALAQHRRSEKVWNIPKGHVEPGETIEQAALREIAEEAGLFNVTLIRYLGSILRESAKENGDIIQKTIHYYLAYASDDHQQPSEPTDNRFTVAGWFPAQQAIQLLSNESDRAFFREHLPLLLALP